MKDTITLEILGIYYLPKKPLRCSIEVTRTQWLIFFFASPRKRKSLICSKLNIDKTPFREFTWMISENDELSVKDEVIDVTEQFYEPVDGHIPYGEFRDKVVGKLRHWMKGWHQQDIDYTTKKHEDIIRGYYRDYCNDDVNQILEGGTAKTDAARARYWIQICVENIEMNGAWTNKVR